MDPEDPESTTALRLVGVGPDNFWRVQRLADDRILGQVYRYRRGDDWVWGAWCPFQRLVEQPTKVEALRVLLRAEPQNWAEDEDTRFFTRDELADFEEAEDATVPRR